MCFSVCVLRLHSNKRYPTEKTTVMYDHGPLSHEFIVMMFYLRGIKGNFRLHTLEERAGYQIYTHIVQLRNCFEQWARAKKKSLFQQHCWFFTNLPIKGKKAEMICMVIRPTNSMWFVPSSVMYLVFKKG